MHRFKELVNWQKAFEIGLSVLQITKAFPRSEQYGLTNQINRSAISFASNNAEGAGRNSDNHFISIAVGSAYELETQMMSARELSYISQIEFEAFEADLHRFLRMMRRFKEHLLSTTARARAFPLSNTT